MSVTILVCVSKYLKSKLIFYIKRSKNFFKVKLLPNLSYRLYFSKPDKVHIDNLILLR